MRSFIARGLFIACGVLAITCGQELDVDAPITIVKRSPIGLSAEDAWALFDRSIEVGLDKPGAPVIAVLDAVDPIVAIKVYGPAPYVLAISGPAITPIGFDAIDLSKLSPGWHTFWASSPSPTAVVELRFTATGGVGTVPEIELWGEGEGEPTERAADLSVAALPAGYVASTPQARVVIAPGFCTAFSVALPRRPELMRRVHLTYRATDLLREFVVKRSINGHAAHGGSWLPGTGTTNVVEEIDPQTLRSGINDVSLCVPETAERGVTIENLRLVGELDRGVDLAREITIGERDGGVLRDGDVETSMEIASGEQVTLSFERLIAPDAIALSGQMGGTVVVTCVDFKGTRSTIASRKVGTAIQVDGGNARCAALVLGFEDAATIAEIDVVGSGAADRVDWPRLVVTSPREHFGELAWVGGFVARPRAMTTAIRVSIGGEPVESRTGDFGRLVKRPSDVTASWTVPVTAAFPDGTSQKQDVVLDRDHHQDLVAARTASTHAAGTTAASHQFGKEGDVAMSRASQLAATKVRLGTRVGLDLPAGAVSKATDITVRHLGAGAVPPLDDGLINVTGPIGHAYEFLPHGQKFTREIDVVLPYDPTLIPEGMTAADVNAYFYDPKLERWVKLPRRALDVGERITRSVTTHFTIMINAVLAVPKSPTPLSFDPTTLSSIAAASPAANIDLIEPPTATSTGDARLALPLRLPVGRGNYSPSLALSYGSGNGNSWLGVGWDLPVSQVTIDTRWGTPTFTPEGDRYVLDGAELVPTTETDGPTCRGGAAGKRFRTRIEGGFAHILRCDHAPGGASHYDFEVHDRDGTRFVYGAADSTDPAGVPRHAALMDPEGDHAIVRWSLRDVVDVHGNTTRFFYDVANTGGPQPGRETYLSKIEYTSHGSAAAIYRVELLRDNGARPDRIISGRSGFKTVIGHLLRRVLVTAENQVVRDYVLTYAHGQFDKSVLSSVREYGTTGCDPSDDAFVLPACGGEFRQHTFDYVREVEGFKPPLILGMEGPVEAQAAPLARGASTAVSRSVDVGMSWSPAQSVFSVNASSGFSSDVATRLERVGTYDVDGNGVPDEVYMTDHGPRVLFNLASPAGFPAPLFVERAFAVPGLTGMGEEQRIGFDVHVSTGGDVGLEDKLGFGSSVSTGWGNSISTARRFLTDLDGDGFLDYLSPASGEPRSALLGRPCASGLCFSRWPFAAVTGIDPRADPTVAQIRADVISRLVLGDPVLQWTAPFSGRVRIDASAFKVNPGGEDGVAVELFHQDTLVSGLSIAAETTTQAVLAAELELDVEEGEALYLRVKTLADDGIGPDGTLRDLVDADLSVVYQRLGTGLGAEDLVEPETPHDPTGAGIYAFDGRRDFRISGAPAALLVPALGTLVFDAILTKRPGAADLRACVQRFAAPSPSATAFPNIDVPCSATDSGGTVVMNLTGTLALAAGSSTSTPLRLSSAVEPGEILVLRVESDLSFDPDDVALEASMVDQPLWSWSRLCELDEVLGVICTTDPQELADEDVPEASSFGPFVPNDPGTTAPRVPLVVSTGEATDLVTVNPLFGLSGEFLFAIRSDRQGIIQQYDCRNVTCSPIVPPPFQVTDGESISFEVVRELASSPAVTGSFASGGTFSVDMIEHFANAPVAAATPFVGGYHGFRAALWNEEEPFAPTSVVADFPDLVDLDEARQIEIRRSVFAPSPSWGGDTRTGGVRAWLGPSSNAYVAAGTFHAGYLGLIADDASFQQTGAFGAPVADIGGLFTGGYLRLSATSSKFIGTEAHVTIMQVANLSADLTVSRSDTTSTTEVVDLNGDGIADVIAGPQSSFLGNLINFVLEEDDAITGHSFDGGFRKRQAYNYALGLGAGAQLSPCTNAFGRPLMQCGAARTDNSSIGFSTAIGWGISRSQTIDDLTDVNGDGMPDIVKRRDANIAVRLNLGNRFGDEEPFGIVADALRGPSDGFAINAERDAPVLGDALDSSASALTHESTVTETRTTTTSAVIYSHSSTRRKSATRTTRQLADLNGDGLQDLLFKRDCDVDSGNPLAGNCDGRIWVQYNRGGDFADPVPWMTEDWAHPDGTAIALSPAFDPGIADLYMTGPDVLAGTGTDTSKSRRNGFGVDIPLPNGFSLNLGAGTTRSSDTDTFELALLDMDGDGAADHTLRRTTVGGTPTIYIKHNQITGQANLIHSVHRPLGGSFTLGYQRVGNTVDLPHSRHVLSRVELDDGQDLGAAFASPNLVTTFEYLGGFFHRYEKEFFGFSRVTTRRADGVSVEEQYENRTYQLHGRLLHQLRRDSANQLLHRRDLAYTPNAVLDASGLPIGADTGCVANLHPLLGLDACVPAFVVMTEETNEQFESGGGSKRHAVRDLSRDRFGNVLESVDDGDDAVTGDEVFAIASYQNDTSTWILGRSTRLEVHAGGLAGPLLRQRTGTYDSRGQMIAVNVDTGTGVATTTLGYDAFGNLVHVTTPPNAASESQTITVEFDSIAHAYPTRVTDGFGYTSEATYDLKYGTALLETDTNGAQLRRTLDTFGRLSTVRGPYDTTQAGITISYYPDESRPRAVTITHASAPADYSVAPPPDLTTVTIVDGLDRPIQVRKTSVVNGGLGTTTAGLVRRDEVGRTVSWYHPFFTPGAGLGFVAPQATPQTSSAFDAQDRVVAVVHPDGADETTAYDLAPSPGGGPVLFRTTSTDANQHVRETYVDLLDRTRAFVEHPGPTTASVTRYDYRATGELARITDAEGNATTLGYDLRGMRTSLDNPDTGLVEERFDLMGNRIALIEPNHRALGAEVRYGYELNRLDRIDYPSKTDVTFRYGAPGAADFRAGRLTEVHDETGMQEHFYGAMGETRRTLRTVIDPAHPTQAPNLFEFKFTTDSLGRQLRIQYPDGERVTNTYDAGGMLKTIVGAGANWTQTYASDLRYDVFGNRTRVE